MSTFRFDPSDTFREVSQKLAKLDNMENKHQIAKLVWLEGSSANQDLTYLYDELAERFGHQVDKVSISIEIVSSLLNDIPVEVRLVAHKAHAAKG